MNLRKNIETVNLHNAIYVDDILRKKNVIRRIGVQNRGLETHVFNLRDKNKKRRIDTVKIDQKRRKIEEENAYLKHRNNQRYRHYRKQRTRYHKLHRGGYWRNRYIHNKERWNRYNKPPGSEIYDYDYAVLYDRKVETP